MKSIVFKVYIPLLISGTLLAGCSGPMTSLVPAAPEPEPVVYKEGELNRETLFDILTAEIAGHQKRFDLAQEKYLKQAELTGDPAVIRRAVRIAQYNKDQVALQKAADIWIKYEPDNLEPFEIMASILLHERQFEAAQPYIRKALTRQSQRILLLINAQAPRLPNDTAKGYLNEISELLRDSPERADLWMTSGLLQQKLARNDDALASFSKAIRYNPSNYDAYLRKADLQREMKRFDEALVTLKPVKKRAPRNKQVLLSEMQVLYAAERNKEAAAKGAKLIAQFPEDDQLQLYIALLALDHGQLEQSEELLKALQAQKERSDLNFYLGLIAEQRDQKETALAYYTATAEGNNIMQAYGRALALQTSIQRRDDVANAINNAIKRHPELAPELYNLHADWLRTRGDKQGAINVLDKGLSTYSQNPTLVYARAMLRPPEEFSTTEKEFRLVLAQDPDNASALNALGYTLTIYTERYDEAFALLDRAIVLKPDDPAVIDSYGWILYKLGRYQEARQYLEKAFGILEDPEVGGHLVVVLIALEEHEAAQQLYNKLQAQFPDSSHLEEAKELLAS